MSNSFVPGEDVIKVDLRFTMNGQQIANTLHFQVAGSPTLTTLGVLAGEVVTWWTTYVKPYLSSDLVFEGVTLTDLSARNGLTLEYNAGLPITGSVNVAGMPGNVAIVLGLHTGKRGKSYNGRTYIAGAPINAITGGYVASALRNYLTTAFLELLGGFGIAQNTLVIASRIAGKALRTAIEATEVVAVTSKAASASQKRRLVGHGR